jgi:uncharacterized protein (TIGR02265 family)
MKVKGNILKSRIGFVKERFGDAGWRKVLAALPGSDQALLNSTINVAWYDFDLADRLDKAIVQALGGGDTRLFEEMGRASAQENLTTVHTNFLKPPDPQKFMSKAPLIYAFYYDKGRRTWEATGPTSGVMTTFDAETYSTADCATVIGWHKQGLSMVGAKNIRIVEDQCRARGNAVCRYQVSWS